MLDAVELAAEVHLLCSSYALCTEGEEVALLLLGDYRTTAGGGTVGVVETCFFVVRKDKRNDRVEISGEELSKALSEAEARGLKVVGWCHSHPKITIAPSHVDLGTQCTLQTMDERFFGIIYAVFHVNQNSSHRLQVTAFQSLRDPEHAGTPLHVKIPLTVLPSRKGRLSIERMSKLAQIPLRLYEESVEPMQHEQEQEHEQQLGQSAGSAYSHSHSRALVANSGMSPAEQSLASLAIAQRVCLLEDKFIVPLLQLMGR